MHIGDGTLAGVRDNDIHVRADTETDELDPPGAIGGADRLSHSTLMDDQYWDKFPEPLKLSDIALILRVSEATALRRLQDGTIPAHFIGRSWIVFKGEFRAWLSSTRNEPLEGLVNIDPLAEYDDQLGMSELMELFDKTKQTIRRWLTDKQVPGYLVGGRWTVYKSELRDALARSSNQRPVGE